MSLRSRLLIAIGVIALVALAVADVVTYSSLESFLYQRVDQQLDQQSLGLDHFLNGGAELNSTFCAVPHRFGPGGGGPGDGGGDGDDGPANAVQAYALEVRSGSGRIVDGQSCAAYVDDTAFSPQIPSTITGIAAEGTNQVAYFTAQSTAAGGPVFRVRACILADQDVLIVAQPLGDIGSTLHHLFLVELVVTGAAVIVALFGGLWLVRIGLRPLRDMERTAESIADGNLTERVPGENETTEVGRLARTLNVMLTRIESAFSARLASERRLRDSEQRLRRFVADVSHELRTPIAAISAYAELFGRGASEQKADLERLMGGIRSETSRMEHLVADLLLLARLDEGRPMEQRSVDLVALGAEAVHTASTVGPEWPVTFEATRPIEVMGDATSLRQVVDNLLANVRAHTPPGTEARVKVDGDVAGAIITVSDNGPGMEPEQAEHVFERFYRSDPSRSRVHGGAGLGLSIVSAIVTAHGGTVSAQVGSGGGSTFVVHLPYAAPTSTPEPGADPAASPSGSTPTSTPTPAFAPETAPGAADQPPSVAGIGPAPGIEPRSSGVSPPASDGWRR